MAVAVETDECACLCPWIGYACFWVLGKALLPASGDCFIEQIGPLKWSNVVCAHEPPVVATLERLAHDGYLARRERRQSHVKPSP